MKEIKIVEYNDSYAAEVAEMWGNSMQGWNGDTFMNTAEDVIQDHKNASYLHAWLALEETKVIGYCNLYEYQEDTGALYIGFLNVRDAYHGKKIGKKLLRKAIETTIELGWERLDLYTWPGNTKAVPLYKKCGFFWEDRDDTTHLMNFIPQVVNNEIAKVFFQKIDWYENSTREIEVKPDGRKENKFEYYTYQWEKNGDVLKMEYARRGRGLRKIETNEYSITVTVENLKLTFGTKYRVNYYFENKTEKPIEIKIIGKDDKNISFSYQNQFELLGKKSVDAYFEVKPIKKEQNDFKKHPGVVSDIFVNGKKAEFRVGIEPKFPLSITIKKEDKVNPLNKMQTMYLDVENGFDEKVDYHFEMQPASGIVFSQQDFNFTLQKKEKKSILCNIKVEKALLYAKDIEVVATKENGEKVYFIVPITAVFHTQNDVFWGKGKNMHFIGNGANGFAIQHVDRCNFKRFYRMGTSSGNIGFPYPHFKQPIQDEFNKRIFDRIEYSQQGSAVKIVLYYSSEKAKGFTYEEHVKLFANGILERWYKFKNATHHKLIFHDNFFINTKMLVIPYKDKIIKLTNDEQQGLRKFDASKVSENWLFVGTKSDKNAIVWDSSAKLNFGEWKFYFEYEIPPTKDDSEMVTIPVQYSRNYYRNWEELRSFVTGLRSKSMDVSDSIDIELNHQNPIAREEISIIARDNRKVNTTLVTNLSSDVESKEMTISSQNEQRMKEDKIRIGFEPIQEIQIEMTEKVWSKKIKKVLFATSSDSIIKQELTIDDKPVKQIANKYIQLRSSELFAPVLFSMQYLGKEWLDSSYPELTCKSWWNPWAGGIGVIPNDIAMKSVCAQPYSVQFAKLKDNHANVWEGIRISSNYTKHDRWKGLIINQYYLLLPGIPIMLHAVEVEQNTNQMLTQFLIESESFIKSFNQIEDCNFEFRNNKNQMVKIQAGLQEYETKLHSPAKIEGSQTNLFIAFDDLVTKHLQYVDTQLMISWPGQRINCPAGERRWMGHKFYIFTDSELNQSMIRDLFTISFQ